MSDMIAEMAARLFAAHAEASFAAHPAKAAEGAARWTPELWREVEELGLPLALAPEDAGGFGLASLEALSLIRVAAAYAAPVPLAETMLANWLLTVAGLPAADGPATLVSGVDITNGRLSGATARAPYGRHAATVVALGAGPDGGALVARAAKTRIAAEGINLAGEPRDDLVFDGAMAETAPAPVAADALPALGAMLRAQQLAGAMEAALELTVSYANGREQFGRPIGKFQAIQQNLAVMAEQTAAARAAADMAAE
ncbi:MAG: acyl-CoA dehydrogenase family protein, partial [Paracoccaceae bacterium]